MSTVNAAWTANMIARIEQTHDCQGLAMIAAELAGVQTAQLNAIAAQLVMLNQLRTAPTNLSSALSYLTTLSNLFGGQYTTVLAQQAAMIAAYAQILAALQSRNSGLKCNLSL